MAQLAARHDQRHPHGALLRGAVGALPKKITTLCHGSHLSVAWDSALALRPPSAMLLRSIRLHLYTLLDKRGDDSTGIVIE
ncbi:hypothetical protein U9M48_044572 [Paspalum notatum var. saurae]|uniref:Uncharacterized protein n=1 Tax=Paspalum notatum var. saurae TaxID=547442 RepID=A0AAQ3UX61_PASNO